MAKNNTLALLGGSKVRETPFPGHPVFDAREKKEVLEVLESGLLSGFIANAGENFLGGPKVKALEEEFKRYFSVRYAVAVNSATAGLHGALAAAGIGPGDEVIVTPYTMSASASAILMAQGIPVFADIDEDTFCIDPNEIEKKITPLTKAIVVVHLFGQSADMDRILKIARKHELAVIEDAAQAPAATNKGKFCGTLGDAGIFSLNQHKTITTGEGGMIVTNDRSIAEKARLIRNHGEVIVGPMKYEDIANTLGWNYRMTELEAAVGIAQFKKLDFLTEHRCGLADYLTGLLTKASLPGITLPLVHPENKHVYFTYPIKVNEEEAGISRKALAAALRAEGIPFGEGYVRPIYLEPMYQRQICYGKDGYPFRSPLYKGRTDYRPGLCPIAERMYNKELILSGLCRYPLKKTDIKDIGRAFDKVFANKSKLIDYGRLREYETAKV